MNESHGAADERIMVLDARIWRLVGWSRIHRTSNSGAGLDQQELGAYCIILPESPLGAIRGRELRMLLRGINALHSSFNSFA
jgi:hypothetical protein